MLSLPLLLAVISAGLVGGFHCIGMCGGIASILSRASKKSQSAHVSVVPVMRIIPIFPAFKSDQAMLASHDFFRQVALHGGRLLTYAIIGAIFGGVGAASFAWSNPVWVHHGLYFFGNFALLVLGLRLAGISLNFIVPRNIQVFFQRVLSSLTPKLDFASQPAFVLGLGWGLLPCGLLYMAAPFALLSGAAWSGAVLRLVFGLSALPHLLLAQNFLRIGRNSRSAQFLRYGIAIILIFWALAGIFIFDMASMPGFLCLTPKS
jgi:hypothetical protein